MLEGPHLVGEALAAGIPLALAVVAAGYRGSAEERGLLAALEARGIEILVTEDEIFAGLTDADSPRGLLAVAHLPRAGAGALPVAPGGIYLYADGLQDPGNLGALARVGEAAGASALALGPGCAHPNHPRALRASAGSLLRLPVAVGAGAAEVADRLAPAHPRWLALVPRGGTDLYRADLSGTVILAVGAEGPGLSPPVAARADLALTIPLAAPVESLNATVAAALVLFEARRRRSARTVTIRPS